MACGTMRDLALCHVSDNLPTHLTDLCFSSSPRMGPFCSWTIPGVLPHQDLCIGLCSAPSRYFQSVFPLEFQSNIIRSYIFNWSIIALQCCQFLLYCNVSQLYIPSHVDLPPTLPGRTFKSYKPPPTHKYTFPICIYFASPIAYIII